MPRYPRLLQPSKGPGAVIIQPCFSGDSLGCLGEFRNLLGSVSIILGDTEFSGCCSSTTFFATTTLGNCRDLRRFVGLVQDFVLWSPPFHEFDPLGDLLVAFQRREFRPMY